jgi:NADPH2:quinone reductase
VLTYGEMPTPVAGPGGSGAARPGVNPADVGRRGGGYRPMEYPRVISTRRRRIIDRSATA